MKNDISSKLFYRVITLSGFMLLSACGTQSPRPNNASYKPTVPVQHDMKMHTAGSIYQGQSISSFYSDLKARQVGDIITIVLAEKTQAKKSATTSTKKEKKIDSGTPNILGGALTLGGRNLLATNIDSSNEFTGEGDSAQSNALTGTISVTVAEVYPNGNLYVRGQKILYLSQGEEHIQISGVVRPADISPNNSISSTLLADARITYSGTGDVADANKMGWLARFFNSDLWPL